VTNHKRRVKQVEVVTKPRELRIVPERPVLKLTEKETMFIAPEEEGATELDFDGGKKTHTKGDTRDSPSVVMGPDGLGDYWVSWGASYNAEEDVTTTYFVPSMTRKRVKVQTPFGVITKEASYELTDGKDQPWAT
jgi:hypothetical protein